MFGLKLVKSKDYCDLASQVKLLQGLVANKDTEITLLHGEIAELKKVLATLETPNGSAELLTDVAETPLVAEKPKRTRVTKKTTTSTTRKKVVKKSEE